MRNDKILYSLENVKGGSNLSYFFLKIKTLNFIQIQPDISGCLFVIGGAVVAWVPCCFDWKDLLMSQEY